MNPLNTIRTLTLVAVALLLSTPQTTTAQTRPDDDSRVRLTQDLSDVRATISGLNRSLHSTGDDVESTWTALRHVEKEFDAGRPGRDAYQELMSIANRVNQVESQVASISRQLNDVQRTLTAIMELALRYEHFDIARSANVAKSSALELGESASDLLDKTTKLKSEIDRVIAKVTR